MISLFMTRTLILFLDLIVMTGAALSQTGRWVEYDLSDIGCYSSGISACNDGLVAFAPSDCNYFLVFDAKVGEWLTLDLGETQTFHALAASGHIALAYTENLLIGYSDMGAVWDTMYYTGALLDVADGYGLSEKLAYFITDQDFYVFDAETGEFAKYSYSVPGDLVMTTAWAKSDYVGVALIRTYPNPVMQLVYSYYTKSFNELANGLPPMVPFMDHGFARIIDEGSVFRMVGYSAYDNQFDVGSYTPDPMEFMFGASYSYTAYPGENTVMADCFRFAESYEYVTANHYAYDTRHGEWVHQYYYYDYDDASYGGTPIYGGNLASDFGSYKGTGSNPVFIIIFDGNDNAFQTYSPNMDIERPDISYRHGGDFYVFWDTLQAWVYNAGENTESLLSWTEGETTLPYAGSDYFAVSRWSSLSETMRTYFYSSREHSWLYADVPEHWNSDAVTSPQYYLHGATPENEVVYYSSPRHQILTTDLTDDDYLYLKLRGDLAYAANDYGTVLFDGENLASESFNFNVFDYSQNGLGTGSAVLCDNSAKRLYGYSNLSGLLTEKSFAEDPFFCIDTGYIGVMTVMYSGSGYNKIYTYNGITDAWIELIPVGAHHSLRVGTTTAVAVRAQNRYDPDYVYAFDPQKQIVAVEEDENANHQLPGKFILGQNYPNPFNQNTTVRFALTGNSAVNLEIFNLLGQKVSTLVRENLGAGHYTYKWNGTDEKGQTVASGIYFYRFQANNFVETKKMVLLK